MVITWQLEEQVSGLPTGSGLTLDNEVNDLVDGGYTLVLLNSSTPSDKIKQL